METVIENATWANEFSEIEHTLSLRPDIRQKMIELLSLEMPGKVTEGGNRLNELRSLLAELINGKVTIQAAYKAVESRLSRAGSVHSNNNRVFASGWAERLVRIQFSRLYNQAVLMILAASGETQCFVPHSNAEQPGNNCTELLAGCEHDIQTMLSRIVATYIKGQFSKEPKIPDHPHCTHVVKPRR